MSNLWHRVKHCDGDIHISIGEWDAQKEWCEKTITGKFTTYRCAWYFELEEDAVAFKLMWT